jgi:Flp pilus assembly secretin CpaC
MTIAKKLIVAAAFTTWCWPAAGQTVPAQTSPVQSVTFRELPLIEGRGELMTFEHDVQKVAVAEPKIADAVVISPREVMINAKTVGRTTVVIWETNSAPVRYNVAVTGDTTEFDNFKKTIMDGANGSPILVTGSGEPAGEFGQNARQDCDQPVAGAASGGTAADPAAGEVCQHRPHGAHAVGVQPVQPQ